MKVLITGLHRSGTSVVAKLLATYTDLSVLDDPEWAIFHPQMGAAYKQVAAYRDELDRFDIVKCPRLGECLMQVLSDFPDARVIFVLRDPRDVYCSIIEAQRSPHPSVSTMLQNSRFGTYVEDWRGVSLSFNCYAANALQAQAFAKNRFRIQMYEDLVHSPAEVIMNIVDDLGLRPAKSFPYEIVPLQLAPLRNKHPADISIKGPGRWLRDLDPRVATSIWHSCSGLYNKLADHAAWR